MKKKNRTVHRAGKTLTLLMSIFLTLTLALPTGAQQVYAATEQDAATVNANGDTVTSPKKIISVVYDDSGSMLFDDGARWPNANYSLQTLTSLLNTEDELYVTYMSDPGQAVKIPVGSSAEIQASVDQIRAKDKQGDTPAEAIDTAAKALDKAGNTETATQYWLVVMTDGMIENVDNDYLQKKLDELKIKQMPNGSSLFVDYLGMGNAAEIKADEGNGLYAFKATDNKITDVMKSLANQISGRIEVDASAVSQSSDTTISVHSDLPLYSLSILSQESAAQVVSAKAENDLKVERNISLDAHDLSKGAKKEDMFGNAAVISNDSKPIYAGDYTVTFSEKVDLDKLTILYEPAIGFNVEITKDGIKVDDPSKLKIGEKISVEIIPVIPGTDTQLPDDILPKGIAFGVQYKVNDEVIKTSDTRTLADVEIKEGENEIDAQMQIPGFVPVTKQVAVFTPGQDAHYSFELGQTDGGSYDRAGLKKLTGEEISFWLSNNDQHMTKDETKGMKLKVTVEDVDKSGITETGFKGFLNRFGFKNVSVRAKQQDDGSYVLDLSHALPMAPFATHAGAYTVKVELKGDDSFSGTLTFTIVPGMREWIWVIVCILLILFIIYVIDILFFKSKFHGQVIYYTQYRLRTDGGGSVQAGQGDSKKLPFITPNLLVPFVTRSASTTFQGIRIVADGPVVKIPGKVIKESVYAYGRSSDKAERHLGRIVKSMKVVNDTKKGTKTTVVPDVALSGTKTYFKNSENDRTVWALHIED